MESIVIECTKPNKDKIDKTIGHILWDHSAEYGFEIIRFKGIIYTETKKYLLQGLYDLYEFEEIVSNSTQSLSKILFIGKNLKKNRELINSFLND
jgi:hypothetical protein